MNQGAAPSPPPLPPQPLSGWQQRAGPASPAAGGFVPTTPLCKPLRPSALSSRSDKELSPRLLIKATAIVHAALSAAKHGRHAEIVIFNIFMNGRMTRGGLHGNRSASSQLRAGMSQPSVPGSKGPLRFRLARLYVSPNVGVNSEPVLATICAGGGKKNALIVNINTMEQELDAFLPVHLSALFFFFLLYPASKILRCIFFNSPPKNVIHV